MPAKGFKYQFCTKGHDKNVMGKSQNGSCVECRRVRDAAKYIPHPKQPSRFCSKGHDKDITGKTEIGSCIKCQHEYQKERKIVDPNFKLACSLRSRLNRSIRKNWKIGSAVKDLGCSIEFLKHYLESKFLFGMSWKNHGKWHIDHIFPLSKFDLTNPIQFKQAVHYTNLQPLWEIDNLQKSNKIK